MRLGFYSLLTCSACDCNLPTHLKYQPLGTYPFDIKTLAFGHIHILALGLINISLRAHTPFIALGSLTHQPSGTLAYTTAFRYPLSLAFHQFMPLVGRFILPSSVLMDTCLPHCIHHVGPVTTGVIPTIGSQPSSGASVEASSGLSGTAYTGSSATDATGGLLTASDISGTAVIPYQASAAASSTAAASSMGAGFGSTPPHTHFDPGMDASAAFAAGLAQASQMFGRFMQYIPAGATSSSAPSASAGDPEWARKPSQRVARPPQLALGAADDNFILNLGLAPSSIVDLAHLAHADAWWKGPAPNQFCPLWTPPAPASALS